MFADLRMLENETEISNPKVTVVKFNGNEGKIKLAALTRDVIAVDYRFRKYFRNGNTELDRFHIPQLTAKQYELIAQTFPRTSKFKEENLKFETASDYYIRKARIQAVAEDLGLRPSAFDLTDYSWDERFYQVYDTMRNIDILEDAWKEDNIDLRYVSSNYVYITLDNKVTPVDEQLYNSLFRFCYTAIVNRKVMLMSKVEQCIKYLIALIESSNGFSENITKAQMATLRSYENYFIELLSDDKAKEFIKSTNDIEMFGKDEACHRDYVETYASICRCLTRSQDISDFEQDLSKIDDPFLQEILENGSADSLSEAYLKSYAG